VTTAGGAALAAAHRVVDGVHADAAVVGAATEPARAPGLAERDVLVIDVRHLADGGAAVEVHLADLGGGQADLGVVAVFGHQRRGDAGRADQLAAATLVQLDVVDHRPEGDVPQAERVTGLDVGVAARHDLVAGLEAVGGQDVGLLAVCVVQQRDARGAVGVVLDGRDAGRHADLAALEVDQTVALLVATPAEAGGDAAVVVTAARAGLLLEQRALGGLLGQVAGDEHRVIAARRRRGLEAFDRHLGILLSPGWPRPGQRQRRPRSRRRTGWCRRSSA